MESRNSTFIDIGIEVSFHHLLCVGTWNREILCAPFRVAKPYGLQKPRPPFSNTLSLFFPYPKSVALLWAQLIANYYN
ncbi:hypothetical protein OUZ56_018141 [Daphnia magna]|uniref:Uncharacterized protein n=1 Tax=Daphnia magna TaxID=35525 RepID=A0ABQ9Z9E9_9CRUS|nr:hypothetical protein OUZ56_018141 [Daphnia magna]